MARACAQLAPTAGLRLALASLGHRWLVLDEEITSLDAAIARTVRAPRPGCWSATASGCRPPPSC
jgi:hypothetical protein